MTNHSTLPATTDIGFYRLPQVTELLGISKSTWWLWVSRGKAPKGIKITPRVTVWKRADIHEFISQIEAEANDVGKCQKEVTHD